jgi:urease accessory protein
MKKLSLSVLAILAAGPALAHTGHGDANGFVHGLMHPIFGPDHLLAMLAVGLWSGFVIPSRFWLGAATFMAAMIAGAGLSWAGVGYPAVETVIVASVVVFGVLVLVARRDQPRAMTLASLGAIAVFASAHGHAHASEAAGVIWHYLAGFLIATAGLHLVGIALARQIAGSTHARLIQSGIGAGIAGAGLWMMAG